MKCQPFNPGRGIVFALLVWGAAVSGGLLLPPAASALEPYVVKPIAQKKVKQLPPGPLFWRVENFATLADAHR